jgi:hypothetical protein
MIQDLTNIKPLSPVKNTLENLRITGIVYAPRAQKASIKQAIQRIKDECQKRYSIKSINDYHITIKRIR